MSVPIRLGSQLRRSRMKEVLVPCWVHAFAAEALVPSADGYTLYWAFYIKRTSWFTPFYMAAIDPFRRIFVYPNAVRTVEAAWAARWEGEEGGGNGQSEP